MPRRERFRSFNRQKGYLATLGRNAKVPKYRGFPSLEKKEKYPKRDQLQAFISGGTTRRGSARVGDQTLNITSTSPPGGQGGKKRAITFRYWDLRRGKNTPGKTREKAVGEHPGISCRKGTKIASESKWIRSKLKGQLPTV